MLRQDGNWWNRPCGGREVLTLALPLMLSTASWSIMHFMDRMFLMWHSADEMAAAMPAGMLQWTLISFPLGVAMYVNTFVAQYHGAGRPDRIGLAVGQGVWLGACVTPLFLCVVPAAPYLFAAVGHHADIVWGETVYFQIMTFGAGAVVIAAAQSAFFTGRGVTWVVMVVDTLACALNGLLAYLWVFGRAGFPEWGIVGAAWATVVSQWAKVLVYWLLMQDPRLRRTYGLATARRFDAPLMRRLLYFGGASGLQNLIEGGAFTVLILFVARLGKEATTATTVAFNINAVAFVPMIGLGIAVSTLVGQELGRGRPHLATRATWTALVLGAIYTSFFAVQYVLAPRWLLLGHEAGASPAEFAAIQGTAVILLRFVAAYCLFDAMQIIFVSAIRGAGDTAFILATSIIVSLAALVSGQIGVLLTGGGQAGLFWWWWVLTGWIFALGMIYLARFLQGRWRTMRVIEPEALAIVPNEPELATV